MHVVQVLSGAHGTPVAYGAQAAPSVPGVPGTGPRRRAGTAGAEVPCATTGAHVRSLTEGLVAHGLRVTVCAPYGSEQAYGFTAAGARLTEVGHPPVSPAAPPVPGAVPAFASLPGPLHTDTDTVRALRRICADADVVHAHGPHAGLLAALALGSRRRHVPLVVTWHTRAHAHGAHRGVARLLERRVARAAGVVLGATTDLVDLARRRGARDARLAPVALPFPEPRPDAYPPPLDPDAAAKVRAEIGAVDRPLVLAVGRLEPLQGHTTALTAARAWRDLEPPPLLAIAGEGPHRAALQARIEAEDLPVRLLGRRDDAFELLAAADVALVPARWEARSLVAQEALRAGVPLVATAVGGLPELVGDAGLLVPYADPEALAGAVTALLRDPDRRAALAAAGRARAACLPTVDDTVAHVLSVYDELVTAD